MPALRALLDDHEQRYGRGDLWRAANEEMAVLTSMESALVACSVFFEEAYAMLSTKSVTGAMNANTMAAICNLALAKYRGEA